MELTEIATQFFYDDDEGDEAQSRETGKRIGLNYLPSRHQT